LISCIECIQRNYLLLNKKLDISNITAIPSFYSGSPSHGRSSSGMMIGAAIW